MEFALWYFYIFLKLTFETNKLTPELGFRVRILSWIFELDFQVRISSWIFELDFQVRISSWIFELGFGVGFSSWMFETQETIAYTNHNSVTYYFVLSLTVKGNTYKGNRDLQQ